MSMAVKMAEVAETSLNHQRATNLGQMNKSYILLYRSECECAALLNTYLKIFIFEENSLSWASHVI